VEHPLRAHEVMQKPAAVVEMLRQRQPVAKEVLQKPVEFHHRMGECDVLSAFRSDLVGEILLPTLRVKVPLGPVFIGGPE